MMMTFQEAYGTLPMVLFRTYRRVNVSPADHDSILNLFGFTWDQHEDIPWDAVMKFVEACSSTGSFRMLNYC